MNLRNLIEELNRDSPLFHECALILPELDDTAGVELHPALDPIGADMASIYRRRFRHLSSRNIVNRGVSLAADYFSRNVGEQMRFALVKTASFKGYAFFNPTLSILLAFPYVAKSDEENSAADFQPPR
jgi:hypothetical protein